MGEKYKYTQSHPLWKNLVCHFPSLGATEGERQRENGKREHVTMVTDSVAPRPSAKMLGHIQHPSVPAVCVCVWGEWCVYCACVCVYVRNADVCVLGDPAEAGLWYTTWRAGTSDTFNTSCTHTS